MYHPLFNDEKTQERQLAFPRFKAANEKLSLKASSSGSKVRISRTLKKKFFFIKAGRDTYCLLSPIPLQFPV